MRSIKIHHTRWTDFQNIINAAFFQDAPKVSHWTDGPTVRPTDGRTDDLIGKFHVQKERKKTQFIGSLFSYFTKPPTLPFFFFPKSNKVPFCTEYWNSETLLFFPNMSYFSKNSIFHMKEYGGAGQQGFKPGVWGGV